MAKVYIAEYATVGRDARGIAMAACSAPPLAEQTVAIGGSSVQSNAFNTSTRFVRIHTDAICSIAIGANPTATASTARMAANQTDWYAVAAGHKIAVITNS